jgi:tetratricopeptide (TPR) repeat protein
MPLLVLAAGVAAYHDCLPNAFVFDDFVYIVQNRAIRSPSEILMRSTRPVISLSLAVNHALGGLDPRGYRLVNVGVHLTAALLLYGVVRRSLERQAPRWRRSAAWAAGLAAMLWVAHPLQTQSVTYIWQRCESLMGMFYLLTLYCVIRSDASAHALAWKAAAVVSCALGMASKEVMVTAPVAVLLYDRAFLAGSWREVTRRRRGLYAALAGTWCILAILMARATTGSGIWRATYIAGYEKLPPGPYLLTQAGVILRYLRLAVWPDDLRFDYQSEWPVVRSVADAWPALLAVSGLLLLTALAWRRRPALGFLGAWFFLILAPTSSFVPLEDLLFEHRMYLPLAAPIVLAVVAGVAWLERVPSRLWWARWVACAGGLALVLALATATARRNLDYRSPVLLWQDTLAKGPNNPRAHHNLGHAYQDLGRADQAMAHYREALRLRPGYPAAHNSLGAALAERGRSEEGMGHFREALRLDPGSFAAHNNLGIALARNGRTEEAALHFAEALRIEPDVADTHNNLGNALGRLGRVDEAAAHFREALRLEPEQARPHYNWGLLLERLGRSKDAIQHYREALRIEPQFAPARDRLRSLEAPSD